MVRSDEKNLPLYYLALFSRHETAYKFWDDVLKYGTDQMNSFGISHVCALKNRMDRRNVESRAGMHEDQSRLQALLRREVR